MGQMQIDLNGARVAVEGEPNTLMAAALVALVANGAVVSDDGAVVPDILLVSQPLVPSDALDLQPMLVRARGIGEAMMRRGSGRILFVVSAVAGMPMRRHPDYSVQMGALLAGMRVMAMTLGPKVLVNALGVGVIGDPPIAGDPAMLSHASLGRAGTVQEIVDTVLFFCDPLNSYTTGQLLSVDGGWSAGYGRNF